MPRVTDYPQTLVTTGSTVNIAVSFVPYDMGGKQNVSLRLRGVQVIKYIPYEDKNPFEETDGFVFERKRIILLMREILK